MSTYKFDPDELMQDSQQVAALILSDAMPKGNRLQDIITEMGGQSEDYCDGFEDALEWVRQALLPAVQELGIPSTKAEKRGALKVAMVAEAALAQAEGTVSSIHDLGTPNEQVTVIGSADDETCEVKLAEDGVWEENHIFACQTGRMNIKVFRRDSIACLVGPRVATSFGTDLAAAEAFARWMCLITMAYTQEGLRVVYVDAPLKLEKY